MLVADANNPRLSSAPIEASLELRTIEDAEALKFIEQPCLSFSSFQIIEPPGRNTRLYTNSARARLPALSYPATPGAFAVFTNHQCASPRAARSSGDTSHAPLSRPEVPFRAQALVCTDDLRADGALGLRHPHRFAHRPCHSPSAVPPSADPRSPLPYAPLPFLQFRLAANQQFFAEGKAREGLLSITTFSFDAAACVQSICEPPLIPAAEGSAVGTDDEDKDTWVDGDELSVTADA
ncbi:hypothetical protein K438DRAFT_1986045 [Mycena galopus ATCC 62051]|nr:hypothetical protein K438DRAFT_1986045 [Mycena galopus ATCC 62051]